MQHPGFQSVCLNIRVLPAASYHHVHKSILIHNYLHICMGHTADLINHGIWAVLHDYNSELAYLLVLNVHKPSS